MRAEEFRVNTDIYEQGHAKQMLLKLAEKYDELANNAEKIETVESLGKKGPLHAIGAHRSVGNSSSAVMGEAAFQEPSAAQPRGASRTRPKPDESV
jgi:hypothetical protein